MRYVLGGKFVDGFSFVSYPEYPGNLEFSIEAAERADVQRVALPSPRNLQDHLNEREMMHLELFLMARDATVLEKSERHLMPGLRGHVSGGERVLSDTFRSYVGSPAPSAILLGDVHNPNNVKRGRLHEAAFGPWRSSGAYLAEALLGLDWRSLGLANANEEDLAELLRHLDSQPVIVALGRSAERACASLGLDVRSVRHPSYARRFSYHDLEGYRAEIRDAVVPSDPA